MRENNRGHRGGRHRGGRRTGGNDEGRRNFNRSDNGSFKKKFIHKNKPRENEDKVEAEGTVSLSKE